MSSYEIWRERAIEINKSSNAFSRLLNNYAELASEIPAIGNICQRRAPLNLLTTRDFQNNCLEHPTEGEYKLKLMQAKDIIVKHIREQKEILIWGDYDVDGMTATTSIFSCLKACGANVKWGIPCREDGYGLNFEMITTKMPVPGLVITVDNGITGREVAQQLVNRGYKLIITDHHLPEEELPKADLILNPKCYVAETDDEYMVSGCFVGAQLGLFVLNELEPVKYNKYLRLCNALIAMSIVSDVIPLNPKIRAVMYSGLVELNNIEHDGLNALLVMCGWRPTQNITSSFLAFNVVPKLNAAGRMSDIDKGMNLLLFEQDESFNKTNALIAANDLKALNTKRKLIERQTFEQALEKMKDIKRPKSLVLHDPNWKPGVIGIVAAKLMEAYQCPTILLCGTTTLHGSGRAPDGVDLHACLEECKDDLEQFGGHKAAVGLAVDQTKLDQFIKHFDEVVIQRTKDFCPLIPIDAEVTITDLYDPRFVMFLSNLEPTDKNVNSNIILQLSSVYVASVFSRSETLCLIVKNEEGFSTVLDKYRGPSEWQQLVGRKIDVLITPSITYFNGNTSVSWKIESLKDIL